MTHTYVTCKDCDQRVMEMESHYACLCGARWTWAGDRLAWPYRQRWRHWGSVGWARVILLAVLLAVAVFVVTVMVQGEL